MRSRPISLLALCLALMLALPAAAEQKQVYQDYEVHYAAMLTSDLTPEVARAYDIPRSGKRAFVMIHTRRLDEDSSVPVSIDGELRNLVGQVRSMQWQQVEDAGSIYSLSHFPVTHRERINFILKITPEGSQQPLPLSFQHQFYTD